MNVAGAIEESRRRLEACGVVSPLIEAQVLAALVLQTDRNWVVVHPEADIDRDALSTLVARRERGEPLAYIVGWREFYGRRFSVTSDVLIPRHETETLVERAIVWVRAKGGGAVLDVGTGSGCIAITIHLECPLATVVASDVSPPALSVAERNAQSLGASVEFVRSDMFRDLGGRSFDLIVSNPPYVGVRDALPDEVRLFEPALALYAEQGASDPFGAYRRLAKGANSHLRPDGVIMIEIGDKQESEVSAVFETEGWCSVESTKDINGTVRVLAFSRHEHDLP